MADLKKKDKETLEKCTTGGRFKLLWENYYWFKEGRDRKVCAGHRDEETDLAEKFKKFFPSFEKILSNSLFV